MDKSTVLLQDDFSGFGIGEFPYDPDHSAAGEYHYVTERGFKGQWKDMVCNYTYNGHGPSWIITESEGRYYMESCRIEKGNPHMMFPTLTAGDVRWKNYRAGVTIRRISTKGVTGIAFCMRDSIDTLVFALENRNRAVLSYRHKEKVEELACTDFLCDCDTFYRLEVDLEDKKAVCRINGKAVIQWEGNLVSRGGKIGLTSACPAQFTDVCVKVTQKEKENLEDSISKFKEEEIRLQSAYPQMKLARKIDLKNFGTSRQVRFGHLLGDGKWQIVLAQAQKRVDRDAYCHISCITAVDLDGRILWQKGVPSEQADKLGKISADFPLQVYDIDGDGVDEVITAHNFQLRILDGRTGAVKKAVKTPLSDDLDETVIGAPYGIYAFDRINPDGIRIANFRGLLRPSDILVKDRYCRVYAFDSDLNLMWKYKSPKNTGHFPMAVDVNGDGKDELLCGYTLLDSHGKELWTYPIEKDHTDEIVAGKFMAGSDKGYFACVSGTQGFFIGDFQGNIVTRDYIGHAQRVSVANYCPQRPGFELAVSNFWGHQGVIYLYDCFGNEIWEMENEMNGNILAPVNWLGSGQDFILTNADPYRGGLLNGDGMRAVAFPDDGHPVMCCEAIDLMGDDRDELVVWDYHSMYIYTQSDGEIETSYHPVKYPVYNASNYRGEYAFPGKEYITFQE
mgnify:FL=1